MLLTSVFTYASDLLRTIRRFPLSAFFSVVYTADALLLRHATFSEPSKHLLWTLLTIACVGCFSCISMQLIAESKQWSRKRCLAFSLLLWAPVSLYIALESTPWVHGYIGGAAFLSIFVAPFLNKDRDNIAIWAFQYKIWQRLFFVACAAVTLFLGIFVVLASIDWLLGIYFQRHIYQDVGLVITILFSSLVAMAGIPTSFQERLEYYPKGLRVILGNILIPLCFLYGILLYIYAAKILLSGNLPKGGVAYIVTGFGCVGVALHLALSPFYAQKTLIATFGRFFPALLLGPLLLLGVGLAERIHTYQLTEPRYTLLLLLLWLFSFVFLGLFAKKHLLKGTYLSLILLLLMGAIGPWSVINLSSLTQLNSLERILTQHQLLPEGHISPRAVPLSDDEKMQLINQVEYLLQKGQETKLLPWFENMPEIKKSLIDKKATAQSIVAAMGVKDALTPTKPFSDIPVWFAYESSAYYPKMVGIKGYDYEIKLSFHQYAATQPHSSSNTPFNVSLEEKNEGNFTIVFEFSSNILKVTHIPTGEQFIFNLDPLLREAYEQYVRKTSAPSTQLTLDKEGTAYSIRLWLDSMQGQAVNQKLTLNTIKASLYIKRHVPVVNPTENAQ